MDDNDGAAFERHAAKWAWVYDNHGNYDGESWTWYYSPRYSFGGGQYVVLLRRDDTGVAVAVHFDHTSPHEIGRGGSSDSHVDALMAAVESYAASHRFGLSVSDATKNAWWKFW